MSKYNFEFKLKLVKENEEGYGNNFLSRKYGVKASNISNWIRQYKMYGENGLRKSMSKTKYSGEFKLSVIKYRQYNELSYRETAEHFKINNPSIIANWKRIYEKEGFEGLNANVGRPIKNKDTTMSKNTDKSNKIKKLNKSEREELIELRQRNEYLEAELLYLKKLDALIQQKKSQTKKRQK